MNDITEQLKEKFGNRLKIDEPLAKHLNYRLGGPAKWLVEVKSVEELKGLITLAKENDVPYFVLGGGSNTLASDEGFEGLVIKLAMREVKIDGNELTAEAGAITAAVARQSVNAGLAGFEWAISLPGTIGGAVRGNAGCFGGEMKDNVKSVEVLRDDEVITLANDDLNFGYRESVIKHSDDIVLSVTLALLPGNTEELKAQMAEKLEKRKATQPLYAGSAGCMFKNFEIESDEELNRLKEMMNIPEAMQESRVISAGWLIDNMDLKGKKIGGAQISNEHGNFIVNLGNATASDIVQLISAVKLEARKRYNIQLQEEVQYVGF